MAAETRQLALLLSLALVATFGCSSGDDARKPDPGLKVANEPLQVPLRAIEPSEDYRLGAPDRIELDVFELEKPGTITKLELEVSTQGDIMVPYVGAVRARGKTITELKAAIETGLARVIVEPQVMVFVKDYRSHQVSVMGAVDKPGVFFLTRNRVTLVEALSLAGGLTTRDKEPAGTRVIVFPPRIAPAIEENRQQLTTAAPPVEIDLAKLLVRGDTSLDIWVEPGSVVQVPQAEEFYVQGYVNKAGSFPFRRPTTVLQAIAVAGGFDERRSSKSCIKIKRPTPQGVEIMDVDGEAIAKGEQRDLPIFPGDEVQVGRTVGWAIYSEFTDGIKGIMGVGFSAGAIR